jgi:tetratricopeptide (TPR) repeat protein
LGNAYLDVSDFEAGVKLHEERLEIARKILDSRNEMDALSRLGYIYIKEGNYDLALVFLRQELEAGQRYKNRSHQASALHGLGVCSGASDTGDKAALAHRRMAPQRRAQILPQQSPASHCAAAFGGNHQGSLGL